MKVCCVPKGHLQSSATADWRACESLTSTIGGTMKRTTYVPDAEPATSEQPQDMTNQVRARAYELYELRGREDGHDLDDWLLAELQLIQKPQAEDS